jgi:hypothetical protein
VQRVISKHFDKREAIVAAELFRRRFPTERVRVQERPAERAPTRRFVVVAGEL